MRKSSKVVSLVLSGLMATSCFTMAVASAAEVDSESTGAFMTAQERLGTQQLGKIQRQKAHLQRFLQLLRSVRQQDRSEGKRMGGSVHFYAQGQQG